MEKLKIQVDFKTKKGNKRPPDSVDISKSVLVCNVFIFLFSAAKASLVPFLTLYFRYLKFSGAQTGIIMGSKTFSALFMAPLWARCAGKRNKRKFVLMFSILMLAGVYLSLTLVPQISVEQDFQDCNSFSSGHHVTSNATDRNEHPHVSQVGSSDIQSDKNGKSTAKTENGSLSTENVSEYMSVSSTTVVDKTTKEPPDAREKADYTLSPVVLSSVMRTLEKLGISVTDLSKMTPKKIRQLAKSKPEGKELYEVLKTLTPKETKLFIKFAKNQLSNYETRRTRSNLQDTWSEIKNKVSKLTNTLKEKVMEMRQQLFLTVLVILVVGELFCSPVEKVADDAWYDFLDEIDDLEKYGRQRLLTSFAFIIFPMITTLLVDFTPCHLGGHIHHSSIHFYMFGGCLGLTFVVALFYPTPTSGKQKYVSKVIKGCRVLCCNGRNFVYIVTLLIMGLIYSTTNHLFWVVQDLGEGKELPMGVAVAVAAFSELPMLIFSDKLMKKLSNCGMIALSLLFLAARQLYYSFLWTNWAVVPIEILHSFTHTAMWWSMLSNPEFSVSTPVNRSIRSILSSLYFGVGYGMGSVVSGFVYDEFGSAILFRGGAILAGSWMLVFLIINKCIPPKSRIRYAKLLQNEDDLSDSSNNFDEDDWLERALKEH